MFDLKVSGVPSLNIGKVIISHSNSSQKSYYDVEDMLQKLMMEHAVTQRTLKAQNKKITQLLYQLKGVSKETYVPSSRMTRLQIVS